MQSCSRDATGLTRLSRYIKGICLKSSVSNTGPLTLVTLMVLTVALGPSLSAVTPGCKDVPTALASFDIIRALHRKGPGTRDVLQVSRPASAWTLRGFKTYQNTTGGPMSLAGNFLRADCQVHECFRLASETMRQLQCFFSTPHTCPSLTWPN